MKLTVEFTGMCIVALDRTNAIAAAHLLEDPCHKSRLIFQHTADFDFNPQGSWNRDLRPVELPGQPLGFELDVSGLEIGFPDDRTGILTATNSYGTGAYPYNLPPTDAEWLDLSHALNLHKLTEGRPYGLQGLAGSIAPIRSGVLTAMPPVDPRMKKQCWTYPALTGGVVTQGLSDRIQLAIDTTSNNALVEFYDRSQGSRVAILNLKKGADARLVASSQCNYDPSLAAGMPDVALYKRCLTAGAKITVPTACSALVNGGNPTKPTSLTPNASRCPPALYEY